MKFLQVSSNFKCVVYISYLFLFCDNTKKKNWAALIIFYVPCIFLNNLKDLIRYMKNVSIIDIIPQRPPFVMMDTLFMLIRKRSTFIFNPIIYLSKTILEAGIIENIAQTCCTNWLSTEMLKNRRIGIY